jgi:hypothetical protein
METHHEESDDRLAGVDHARHAADRRGVGLVVRRGLVMEKSRSPDDQVDQMSQALNRLRTW